MPYEKYIVNKAFFGIIATCKTMNSKTTIFQKNQ